MCQQVLTNVFNEFCSRKNRAKIKQVEFRGEVYNVFSFGQLCAMGANFDLDPDPETNEPVSHPYPRLIVWEIMPEKHDLRTPVVFEVSVQRRGTENESIFVRRGKSSFSNMSLFSRIIEMTEALAGDRLVSN